LVFTACGSCHHCNHHHHHRSPFHHSPTQFTFLVPPHARTWLHGCIVHRFVPMVLHTLSHFSHFLPHHHTWFCLLSGFWFLPHCTLSLTFLPLGSFSLVPASLVSLPAHHHHRLHTVPHVPGFTFHVSHRLRLRSRSRSRSFHVHSLRFVGSHSFHTTPLVSP